MDAIPLNVRTYHNIVKVHIFLEELKAVYGLEYTYRTIKLQKGEHKQEWYLEVGLRWHSEEVESLNASDK